MAEATDAAVAACRLCGGRLAQRFRRTVLRRLDVAYLQCAGCGSLQTQEPTWLAQAYEEGNLAQIDAGGAQRSLFNAAAASLVARVFGLRDALDVGGGDGLLCRLLRDQGLNAYVRDPHAAATYARGFTQPDFTRPDLLTAFEVVEHFAEPRRDLEQLFAGRPRYLLLTTQLYESQDEHWWYLVPETGQHVFFYSRRAMEWIGTRFDYRVRICPGYILLAHRTEASGARQAMVQALLRGAFLRLVLAAMFLRPARGAWNDLQRLRRQAQEPASAGRDSERR
jgi:hypothetical protein